MCIISTTVGEVAIFLGEEEYVQKFREFNLPWLSKVCPQCQASVPLKLKVCKSKQNIVCLTKPRNALCQRRLKECQKIASKLCIENMKPVQTKSEDSCSMNIEELP